MPDFRRHPLWLSLCLLSSFWGVVSAMGCGSGRSGTGDYLAEAHAVRWQTHTVLYWVEPHDSSIPGIDPPRTVERGLRKWQEPLTGRLTLTKTEDRDAAQIRIRFGTRDEVGTRQGFTNLFYDNSGQFLRRAEVVIYRSLTPPTMEATSLHEGGHALGWRGHVGQRSSVMFNRPDPWKPLSPKDERTIQAIYSILQ